MERIYVISGLGADHTVFQKLDLPGFELVHIKWVKPEKADTLNLYAQRLIAQIKDENPIVMGLSLGGMLALEIADLVPTKLIISLSSIIGYNELPWYLKLAGRLRLQKILPIHVLTKANRLNYWLFGVKKTDDKKVLDDVILNMDKAFLYWALNAIVNWRNPNLPSQITRIHGDNDLVLPAKGIESYDYLVKGGTHLMVLDKSEEVSHLLMRTLKLIDFRG